MQIDFHHSRCYPRIPNALRQSLHLACYLLCLQLVDGALEVILAHFAFGSLLDCLEEVSPQSVANPLGFLERDDETVVLLELNVGHRLSFFAFTGTRLRQDGLERLKVIQELFCALLMRGEGGIHATGRDSLQFLAVLLAAADQEPGECEVLQLSTD